MSAEARSEAVFTPTNAQLRLLRAIDRCTAPDNPADGWGEVYSHFDESHGTPSALAMATFDRISNACIRRGWVVVDEASVNLTDAGRAALKSAGGGR